MKAKRCMDHGIDYSRFSSPWVGLATMIFAQAENDMKLLDGREVAMSNNDVISKWEIVNFLRSSWAAVLADGIGVDEYELMKHQEALLG